MPATLANSSYVFVRRDSHRPPLTPPYEGPYKVLTHDDKTFLLDYGNRQDSVSIDRLKPAFLDPVKPVEAAKRAPRGRPATNVETKSGRLVKHALRITTLSRWSSLCASVILRAMPAGIRVSLVGLTMPDWSRVRFQTKSDPWSSRLGVGRQANNLLP